MKEITIGIGGAAGDGIASVGDMLSRVASRSGLDVYVYNSYQSVIRGGHVWLRCRVSEEKVTNHGDSLDVLIALNQDTLDRHAAEVDPGGLILFDGAKLTLEGLDVADGVNVAALPVKELMSPHGRLPVLQNVLLLGACLRAAGFDLGLYLELLERQFGSKGEKVVGMNLGVAQAGWDADPPAVGPGSWSGDGRERSVVSGNQMFAMGAVAAGCRFYSAYPMTPASSILHWFAANGDRLGVLVKQMEDEIAVINVAIGAAHAGARSMCGTSGGGFALMTEAIGLAAMTETPLVVINAMRGGPSTGLPTKTEQADFNQLYGASQGDFPRAIVAPSDPVDAFSTMADAFNLAERYQMPVLVASDLLLSEHNETVEIDAVDWNPERDRGEIAEGLPAEEGVYLRYKDTPTGVSPRSLPGMKGGTFVAASDEHDESSVLISDVFTNPAERIKQVDKRARKMDGAAAWVPDPVLEGPEDHDLLLVVWGSTRGVALEAAARLTESGTPTAVLTLKWLLPFPAEAVKARLGSARAVMVEQNHSGQVRRHVAAETGVTIPDLITRYDGEPMEPAWLVARLEELL